MRTIVRAGLVLGAVLGASGCTAILGGFDFEGKGGAGGGTSTSTGSGGGGAATCSAGADKCASPEDCPATGNECVLRTCEAGCCGTVGAPQGTAVSSQIDGDCKVIVCDGIATTTVDNDLDVEDDQKACTKDSCLGGAPVHAPIAPGAVGQCAESGGKVCGALGGPAEGTCVVCNLGPECATGVCQDNTCVPAECDDQVKNGSESDVDCGGAVCGKCIDGKTCTAGTDCQSKVCDTSGKCKAPGCNDGQQNGGEADVDCGGPCATKCAVGDHCGQGSDCTTGVCSGNTCQAATCSDGVENGTESDKDCGASCPTRCAVGQGCLDPSDCASLHCVNAVCAARPNGQSCSAGAQCVSGLCVDGTCCESTCTAVCKSCANAAGTCTTDVAQLAPDPTSVPACVGTSACDGSGACKRASGQACSAGGECASGRCADGVCCDSACAGTCMACNLMGKAGTCSPVAANASDPGTCAAPLVCDGAGACSKPPSCDNGSSGAGAGDCGPLSSADCCDSKAVPGGTFKRDYDGVDFTVATFPATVSAFRLDTYEITVGRFRKFVEAGKGTQASPPQPGDGAHPLIANSGWQPPWGVSLPADTPALLTTLKCGSASQTWTDVPGPNEKLPLNCLDWFQAAAFCAWDGGRLPTLAEWEYAAAGGDEQRYFPWSVPANSTVIDATFAVYDCNEGGAGCDELANILTVGRKSPKGDGRWGHADLGGSMMEWTLDLWGNPLILPCFDCADVNGAGNRVIKGGSHLTPAVVLRVADTSGGWAGSRNLSIGARCARNL